MFLVNTNLVTTHWAFYMNLTGDGHLQRKIVRALTR